MTGALSRAQVLAVFAAEVRRLCGQPGLVVEEGDSLLDLGELDSLRIMAAVALTEIGCGVEIDTAFMAGFETVGDVVEAVLAAAAGRA